MLSYDKSHSIYNSHHSILTPLSMPGVRTSDELPRLRHKHLFIVTGPAGCGKTTIAKHLADYYGLPYIEGDDYHPTSNVEKMSNGIPLTDADRWDWLIQLKEASLDHLDTGIAGAVVTCSALKRKYRDVIRVARLDDHEVRVHFIYLRASEDLLLQRVKARKGHYMKPSMVKSQLESLEEPKEKERDVHSIDVSGSKAEVQRAALDAVTHIMAQDIFP